MSQLYTKHFAGMYDGSMVGKGAMVFALMGYVVGKMECTWTGIGRAKVVTEGRITLNPKLLAATLGELESDVVKGIDVLCAPDPDSRSKEEDGRRLVRIGQFDYRVVNAPYYQNLKNKADQREKARLRQQKFREKSIVLSGKDAEAYQKAAPWNWKKRRKIAERAGAKAAKSGSHQEEA